MQNKSFGKNILQGIGKRVGKIFHNPYAVVNIGPLKKIYYKHLSKGELRSHLLFGKKFYFVSPTEFMHGMNEIFLQELYKQNLPAKPYIIDCGANIGLSVIYIKHMYADAEILAFEPDETNFRLLSKNIESFGFKNVIVRKEAVWTENKTLQFAGEGSMSSRIDEQATGNTINVKAVRLKDFLNRPVDFLKIDIEGAEFEVMKHILGSLQVVKNLFLEYHGTFEQNPELTQIFTMLTQVGFSYYIKEAAPIHEHPFINQKRDGLPYDVQLNIFCFRQ